MKVQEFVRFRDIQLIQPQRLKIVLPAFTLAAPTWHGSSEILTEYPFGNSYYFTLKRYIRRFGANFIFAVRFVENGIVFRYKFWDDSSGVLLFPIYDGDVLGPNAVFEIWSVNNAASLISTDQTFDSSVLAFQTVLCTSCCSNPDVSVILQAAPPTILAPGDYCNPFCDTLSTTPVVPPVVPPPPPPPPVRPFDPVWPDRIPLVCPGYAYFGPIQVVDQLSGLSRWVGINPGADDPITYLSSFPGCMTAWADEVWRQFLASGTSFSNAQFVWGFTNFTGGNWNAIAVFPGMPGGYSEVIDLNTYIDIGYCP